MSNNESKSNFSILLSRRNIMHCMVLVCLLAASSACLLTEGMASGAQTGGSLVLDHVPAIPKAQGEPYELSHDQQARVQLSGSPDRFLILFFQEEDSSQQMQQVRMETWYYDRTGLEVMYRNGSLILESVVDPVQMDGVGRTSYNPEMFSSWMGLDHIITAVGQKEFYRQLIPDDPTPGRELIYFQGLVVGLQSDRIMYVETMPIGAAALPYQQGAAGLAPAQDEPDTAAPDQEPAAALQPEAGTASLSGTVIYTSSEGGNYEVHALDLESGDRTNLSASPAEDVYAACSPGAGTIAFISDRSGTDQVYTINADGSGLLQVTDSSSSKDFLNWYSDNELIYWQWGGSLENSYVLVSLSGGSETPVEEEVGKAYSTSIAVAAGAEWVATSEQRDGQDYEIWILEVTTGAETQITDNDTADTNPVWSPDGSLLMFSNQGELWVYDMQDGNTTQVTRTEGVAEAGACWLGR